MNHSEITELKKGIILTAQYYGRELKDAVIGMMADDLSDLDFQKVSAAFLSYRRNPKNKFFPLPAQIRELVLPEVTAQAQARNEIDNIKKAIRDYGYSNSTEARLFLGPVAWAIVQGNGGWLRICQSDFIFNPALIAQARTRAEDIIQFGAIDQVERIEAPKSHEQIEAKVFQLPDFKRIEK